MGDTEEEEHRLERIAHGASQPIGWWLGAADLKAAAEVLANSSRVKGGEFGIERVYRMLMGFALENLLKGLLVSKTPDRYVRKHDKLFDWGKNGHDLVKLAQQAGLKLAEDELGLCRRLSIFSTWGGRYWFSMSAKEMGDGFSPVFDMDPSDRKVAEHLYDKWSALLQPAAVGASVDTDT